MRDYKKMKYKEYRLFYQKRLALAILQEIKNRNSPVELTDSLGNIIDIDKAIEIVRNDIYDEKASNKTIE